MLLVFQSKTNIEIIKLMHSRFDLDSSDIDLLNIDLLDTHLDLLDTDIPSKHFAFLLHVLKTSWRRPDDVFSVIIFRLLIRLQDVFKTSWRRLERRKIVTLKTCWRPTNVCWEVSIRLATRKMGVYLYNTLTSKAKMNNRNVT